VTVRAVVFDVGGTIVDERRVIGAWAGRLGVGEIEFFATLGAVIERREHHNRLFEAIRPGWSPTEDDRLYYEADDLFPDARRCLERLRDAGYTLAVAANQPAWTESFLAELDLPLDLITTSEGWGVSKPDPAFYARLVAELALDPSEIAYVGDRVDNDVIPSVAAGLVSVFVRRGPWGFVQASWPEAEQAHLRLDSLDELPDAIASLS
jgi:HAD superfamily hydrolase (TIGR01662 family)